MRGLFPVDLDSPDYQRSLVQYRMLRDELNIALYPVLRADLPARLSISDKHSDPLLWASFGDLDPLGGYWLHAGIRHEYPNAASNQWATIVSVQYLHESPEGELDRNEEILDLRLTGPGARDPYLIRDLFLGVLARHHDGLKET